MLRGWHSYVIRRTQMAIAPIREHRYVLISALDVPRFTPSITTSRVLIQRPGRHEFLDTGALLRVVLAPPHFHGLPYLAGVTGCRFYFGFIQKVNGCHAYASRHESNNRDNNENFNESDAPHFGAMSSRLHVAALSKARTKAKTSYSRPAHDRIMSRSQST
jgi:hypothetical protein